MAFTFLFYFFVKILRFNNSIVINGINMNKIELENWKYISYSKYN